MIKKISILFFISYLFSDNHQTHNCNQDIINLISPNEPFFEFKKEKCYTSSYTEHPPVIDGILDERIWGNFNRESIQNYVNSFIQEEPQNMGDPSFRTLVKILHDNNNIYIAAKLFDSNPDSINKVLSRKDDWERAFSDQSDWFSIEFDSKHDHQSGYVFSVNNVLKDLTYINELLSDLPNAEKFYEQEVSLPIYPNLSKEDQNFVINQINQFYAS